MSAPTRRRWIPRLPLEQSLLFGAVGAYAIANLGIWGALRLTDVIAGTSAADGLSPIGALLALATGKVTWSTTATWSLIALAIAAGLLSVALLWLRRRMQPAGPRVDKAAVHMGSADEITRLTEEATKAKSVSLGCGVDSFGLPIARAMVPRDPWLYMCWEDVAVHIWGPRTGKTSTQVIPGVLEAPGACVVTSNKRDVVDATRDPRAARPGAEVWVFDPQGIAGEEPTWWWNPLTFVTDEVSAARQAKVFADASREVGARSDAYFTPAAVDLNANLLLAAALGGKIITDVYLWVTRPTDFEPVFILREKGFELSAASLDETMRLPDKQRAGIYGTAKQMLSFLVNRQAVAWVTPGAPGRRQFNAEQFARSGDTLYSLSKEGVGTAGPLVLALTVAVMTAAETYASTQKRGRMPVPMVVELDEAANVCRWMELPDMYSHYGSRGIIVKTFLQSWSQGVEVWGREGMRKLWSAATVRVYGGGVAEPEFLNEVSALIGDYERTTRSESESGAGMSRSWSGTNEQVLSASDLGSLPQGRIVVFGSGVRPVLAKPRPWKDGPHAAAVQASIDRYDVGGTPAPALLS